MSMPLQFADWYRSAAVDPPEGLLEKRWATVETLARDADKSKVIAYATCFALAAHEKNVPSGFRESFHATDDTFPIKDNLQEVRVLAGAVLHQIILAGGRAAATAALALACGTIGPRVSVAPTSDHVSAAHKYLIHKSRDLRRGDALRPSAHHAPTAKRLAELFAAPIFQNNQLPGLHQPLLAAVTELSAALADVQGQTAEMAVRLAAREEEINILWWLQTGFSRDLQLPFSDVGVTAGSLIFPSELADLTSIIPGPDSILAVLVDALGRAGASSAAETVTIAQTVNATSRAWREQSAKRLSSASVGLLCPISLAISTSLVTDGARDWLPVYCKASDISPDAPYKLADFVFHVYLERLLVANVAA